MKGRYVSPLFICAAVLATPMTAWAQTKGQLIDAFVEAAQRPAGALRPGVNLFLIPLDPEVIDTVRSAAYARLEDQGFKIYEGVSWPDSSVTLMRLGEPRQLRSALEVSVHFLHPNRSGPRPREGLQPFSGEFRGYVLTCEGGECTLSQEAVLGNGGGFIRLECLPDYFRRTAEERVECLLPPYGSRK